MIPRDLFIGPLRIPFNRTIKKKTHRGVGLIRFKEGNKLGGYFLLLKTLPKINEKLTEEIMMSASTSISSSTIHLLFFFLVKNWFFLEPGGHELLS